MKPLEKLLGVGVLVSVSILYFWTTGQHPFYLDSMEFVVTSWDAGIAHPPGTPLYTLLAHLACLIPLGSIPFRINVLTALFGGGSAFVLYLVMLQLRPLKSPAFEATVAAVIAFVVALSPALWFQSVRAEVYSLNIFICLLLAWLTLQFKSHPEALRWPLLIAFVAGLGLANHHLLVILTVLALLPFVFLEAPLRRVLLSRNFGAIMGFGTLGFLAYLYLPLRAHDGWMMWGDPSTLGGFYSIVSAEAFHMAVTQMEKDPIPVAMIEILVKWVDLLGPILFLSSFAGLIVLVIKDRKKGLLLLSLVVVGLLAKAIMYLDVENPDDHGYFLIGLMPLAAATMGLLHIKIPWKKAHPGAVSVALLIALTANGALLVSDDGNASSLAYFPAPDAFNRHFLEEVPPDSVFMPSYFAMFFSHLYFHDVEHRRPDVAMVHQTFYAKYAGGAAYAQDIVKRYPDLKPLFDSFMETHRFPLEAARKLAERRPIILENDTLNVTADSTPLKAYSLGAGGLTDPNFFAIPTMQLQFVGPGLQLLGFNTHGYGETQAQQAFWHRFYQTLKHVPKHKEVDKLLLWIHYRNVLYFINRGKPSNARFELLMSLQHAIGSDQRLRELDATLKAEQKNVEIIPKGGHKCQTPGIFDSDAPPLEPELEPYLPQNFPGF